MDSAQDQDRSPDDDEDIKLDKSDQEVPEEKRNRRLEMNRIAAQRSRQRKKEKMLSLSEAVSRLTEENNRLNLENRCLAQTQADQEQELLRSQDNTILMQRYISIMDLSLQCVTTQLLLAKGEQPTEEKVDLTALRLTQSVSAMMKQVKTQQLHQQHLHQRLHQMKQQLRRQNGMQPQERNHKAPSLQQSNKMLGQSQAGATRSNLLQQLDSPAALRAGHQNSAQMFAPKPMGKPSALGNSPLLQMRKQLYANRMNSGVSNPSARGNNMVGGGAFGANPRNPNLSFAGLPGFSGGNVGDKSSIVGRLAGGMAAGLPGMSSSLMNTMKYMSGMKGLNNPMNDSKPSLLGGMGGIGNSLGGISARLGNMTRASTATGASSAGSVNNGMNRFPGMHDPNPNLTGLKDMLDTPNNRQIPVGQKLLQQTVLNHMLQNQQQQKKRQGKFHATVNTLLSPASKRGRLDATGSLVKPVDIAEVPKLPKPASPAPAVNGLDSIQSTTASKTAESQLNAASTLTRMLDVPSQNNPTRM